MANPFKAWKAEKSQFAKKQHPKPPFSPHDTVDRKPVTLAGGFDGANKLSTLLPLE
jgi:hypothetical protein